MLKELVEIDNLSRTDHGLATSSVSILLGIFRAIQKAEDLGDSSITPKLHILAKIGLLIVKELDKGCNMSDSPRHILLPSSYYRLSRSERKADECCQGDFISDSFVKRILKAHEPYNHQEDTRSRCSIIADRVSIESAPVREACSSLSKLVGHNVSDHDKGKTKKGSVSGEARSKKKDQNTNHSLEKEKVSSCGSAGTKLSSPGSLGLGKEADSRDCISVLENQNRPASGSSTGETRDSKTDHNYCRQAVMKDTGEVLVGCHVRLWSALDMRYNYGTVEAYDQQNGYHKITYENGDKEFVCLECQKWEFINDTISTVKDIPNCCPRDCSFFKKDRGKGFADSHKQEMLLPGSSIVCDLDKVVGDCADNFVKRPFSNNKTAVSGLKKSSKRARI